MLSQMGEYRNREDGGIPARQRTKRERIFCKHEEAKIDNKESNSEKNNPPTFTETCHPPCSCVLFLASFLFPLDIQMNTSNSVEQFLNTWQLGWVCPPMMMSWPLLSLNAGRRLSSQRLWIDSSHPKRGQGETHIRREMAWTSSSFSLQEQNGGRGRESDDEERGNETTHSSWSPWSCFFPSLHPPPLLCVEGC